MHMQERYQAGYILAAVKDGTDTMKTASGIIAAFPVPPSIEFTNNFDGGCEVLAFFAHALTAGGAQTVAGVVALYINGVESTVDGANWSRLTSVADHAFWDKIEAVVEDSFEEQDEEIVYPTFDHNDTVDVRIVTQGTGAGDQDYAFFLVYRHKYLT